MSIYVTSDLHGYPFEHFQKFLSDTGFCEDDRLFILGDVIDRGPDGDKYLLWLLDQPNVRLILGNHEAMLMGCAFAFERIITGTLHLADPEHRQRLSHWIANGCMPTLNALSQLMGKDPDKLLAILEYLDSAPLYLPLTVGERSFLLVHGGLGGFNPDKALYEYTPNELVWHRPAKNERYFESVTTIIGHTPTEYYDPQRRGRMLTAETWIDIDTSAAYGCHPMLLRLDDMQEFYIAEDAAQSR